MDSPSTSPQIELDIESAAIGRISGEFVDSSIEREYDEHRLLPTARRVVTASITGAVLAMLFVAPQLEQLGSSPVAFVHLGIRVLFVSLLLGSAAAVRRNERHAFNFALITAIEAILVVDLLMLVWALPRDIPTHNLGFVLLVMAIFLLIPNRFILALALATVTVVAFIVLGFLVFDQPPKQQFSQALIQLTVLFLMATVSNQIQKSHREEFRSLKLERSSKVRLVDEITRRQVVEDELTWLANHDALTDLLNRRAFYEQVEREASLARRANVPLSVLVIDADEFKRVNDRYGHHAGDEALRQIAAACKLHLRTNDVIGRMGGEEFAAVMPGASLGIAQAAAERLRKAIAESPISHPDGEIRLSVSIGATEHDRWAESVIDTIGRADAAMYDAKAAGRNCVISV